MQSMKKQDPRARRTAQCPINATNAVKMPQTSNPKAS